MDRPPTTDYILNSLAGSAPNTVSETKPASHPAVDAIPLSPIEVRRDKRVVVCVSRWQAQPEAVRLHDPDGRNRFVDFGNFREKIMMSHQAAIHATSMASILNAKKDNSI